MPAPECPTDAIVKGLTQFHIDPDVCADHAACVKVCPGKRHHADPLKRREARGPVLRRAASRVAGVMTGTSCDGFLTGSLASSSTARANRSSAPPLVGVRPSIPPSLRKRVLEAQLPGVPRRELRGWLEPRTVTLGIWYAATLWQGFWAPTRRPNGRTSSPTTGRRSLTFLSRASRSSWAIRRVIAQATGITVTTCSFPRRGPSPPAGGGRAAGPAASRAACAEPGVRLPGAVDPQPRRHQQSELFRGLKRRKRARVRYRARQSVDRRRGRARQPRQAS